MSNNALISGANKGIGIETARQLGKLGYKVYLGARDIVKGEAAEAELKAEGLNVEFVLLDMSAPSTFQTVYNHIESLDGHLDVLVNNAGVILDFGVTPSELPIEKLKETFDVNFFAQVELTQLLLPLIKKSLAGRIVNVSSILGSLTLNSDPTSALGDWRSLGYNSSKAALNAFTTLLAFELRNTKIKVNSAHPGWVKTDLGGPNALLDLEDGAKTSVWLATLPDDGPTGGFYHLQAKLPW
ncbi:MAG: SDR family NAD(P)-dependent oxidoreductase [Armatimonadetes bacterium]|nr:SDR family NAD(P)-dependent oxidoreductase [Armatimonadota bacterium]